MIVTFTDFGAVGPYLGQMEMAIRRSFPAVPVITLMADAPAFDPRTSAYLLAALVADVPAGAVVLAVVDPGVGGERPPLVARIDGRWFVGPGNGLFEPLLRRADSAETWEIVWRPDTLSASFHGRDLFAPVAARLAAGNAPEAIGCRSAIPRRFPDWPDDLAEVIYLDHYGNAWTGLRAAGLAADTTAELAGRRFRRGRTFGDVPKGTGFWYENSSGLVEIAINGGRAAEMDGVAPGAVVTLR